MNFLAPPPPPPPPPPLLLRSPLCSGSGRIEVREPLDIFASWCVCVCVCVCSCVYVCLPCVYVCLPGVSSYVCVSVCMIHVYTMTQTDQDRTRRQRSWRAEISALVDVLNIPTEKTTFENVHTPSLGGNGLGKRTMQLLRTRFSLKQCREFDLAACLRRPNKCQKRPTIGAKETCYGRTFENLPAGNASAPEPGQWRRLCVLTKILKSQCTSRFTT
jgi:hypothetical protein